MMRKKWLALLLTAAMLLSVSGLALAAPDGGEEESGGPPFGDPPGWTVVGGAQELEEGEEKDNEEGPELGRPHPFKDKQIGPPAFVMEMLENNIHVMERNKFLVHGLPFESELPPVIKEGRTLVPVRALANALGAEVEWDGEERTVTITKAVYDNSEDLVTVTFCVDADDDDIMTFTVKKGDEVEEYKLDVSAQIFQNRTFVPIRFVAIAFGEKVGYDQLTRIVYLGEDAPGDSEEDGDLEELEEDAEEDEDEDEENDDDDDE